MNSILASEKAFELANKLDREGLSDIAEEIRISIYGGATGLEIVFRLRSTLNSLDRGKKIPAHLLSELNEIKKILK